MMTLRASHRRRQRQAIDAHHHPMRADRLDRVLQPRARSTAQIEHARAGVEEAHPPVDVLELVHRTRGKAFASRLAEEGVVAMPAIAELTQTGRAATCPAAFFEAFIGFLASTSFWMSGTMYFFTFFVLPLRTTKPLIGPGTEPLTRTTFLSSRTLTTTRSEEV